MPHGKKSYGLDLCRGHSKSATGGQCYAYAALSWKGFFLEGLIEAGKYREVTNRCYPLADVVEATRYVETEQKTGNVVLTINGGLAKLA